MWTSLHAKFHQTLRQRHLLPPHQRLLVAVSGGQDSLCLIKLLLDLQPKWHWHLGIVTCDHRWRPDSEANADYVEQLANTWHLSCYRHLADPIPTSEAAARQWRYQLFSTLAQTHHYPYIVTGHTATDRAETLLYNLIRGSGADGLQALTWQRPLNRESRATPQEIQKDTVAEADSAENPLIPHAATASKMIPDAAPFPILVRPLLEMTRTQTGQFCQEQQLKIWEDSTNQDLKYARNRIRNELIPYLKTHFNSQVEETLTQTSEILRAEVEYLEEIAQQWQYKVMDWNLENSRATLEFSEEFSDLNHSSHTQSYSQQWESEFDPRRRVQTPRINRRVLREAPLALQRRVLRQILLKILPLAPNFDHVEKLTALITAPNRSQTDPFPGGLIAYVRDPWIILAGGSRE